MKILKNTLECLTRPYVLTPYSDFAYTKVLGVASQYILWSRSSYYPLRSIMLKNKRVFFISNFKINTCFLGCTT